VLTIPPLRRLSGACPLFYATPEGQVRIGRSAFPICPPFPIQSTQDSFELCRVHDDPKGKTCFLPSKMPQAVVSSPFFFFATNPLPTFLYPLPLSPTAYLITICTLCIFPSRCVFLPYPPLEDFVRVIPLPLFDSLSCFFRAILWITGPAQFLLFWPRPKTNIPLCFFDRRASVRQAYPMEEVSSLFFLNTFFFFWFFRFFPFRCTDLS